MPQKNANFDAKVNVICDNACKPLQISGLQAEGVGMGMRVSRKKPTMAATAPKVDKKCTQALNHPQPGSTIKVEPIRKLRDVALLKKLLADHPRDFCIFVLGTNTNLRASDILRIKIGQVRHAEVGSHFTIRETKTQKLRAVSINVPVHSAIKKLLVTRPDVSDDDYLFVSQKTRTRLTVPYLSQLVKSWCHRINLPGNYASHTLRKTWGYMMRTQHGVDIPTLMIVFNHSSQRQTLTYLGIQESDVQECYMKEV